MNLTGQPPASNYQNLIVMDNGRSTFTDGTGSGVVFSASYVTTNAVVQTGLIFYDGISTADNVNIYGSQSVFVVQTVGNPNIAGIGGGIVFADQGFESLGGVGFYDNNQTAGRVAIWNASFPALQSSTILIAELTVLSGVNTGSSLQSQLNAKQVTLVTGSTYPITASWGKNAATASFLVSASYSTNTKTALNLSNGFVTSLDPSQGGNGINVIDADGSSMGITGGGISIIWNPTSSLNPFKVANTGNFTLSFIDGHGGAYFTGSVTASIFSGSTVAALTVNSTSSIAYPSVSSGSIALGIGSSRINFFTGSSNVTWSLNNATTAVGVEFYIKNSGAGLLTITSSVANQIYTSSAGPSYFVPTGSTVHFVSDGTYWQMI